MDKQRQGEIALALIKNKFRKEGVKISSNIRREIGQEVGLIAVSTDEAMEFMEIIVRELVEETFNISKPDH